MKTNEKGFGLVEVVIVLVVIGLIGGIGWSYWRSKSVASKTEVTHIDKAAPAAESKKPPGKDLPFTYTAPAGWDTSVYSEGEIFSVTHSAPGTKTDGEAYEAVVQGAEIYLNCPKTVVKSLEQLKETDTLYRENSTYKQDITVSQSPAVQYVVGYEGPERRITTFFVGSTECSASIEENVYMKPEYATDYDQLIESIKF